MSYVDTGEAIFFSIGIFQFGLGAYDLYLINKNDAYRKKVLACADWAVNNQEVNGAWELFPMKIVSIHIHQWRREKVFLY